MAGIFAGHSFFARAGAVAPEIAQILSLSVKTVANNRTLINQKLL